MATLISIVVGGLVGWFITHQYHMKANKSIVAELNQLRAQSDNQNTMARFEQLTTSANWEKELIDNEEVWICNADRTFQVHVGPACADSFSEEWTKSFQDQEHNRMIPVLLKINGTTVKELLFVATDGFRYLLPLPRRTMLDGHGVHAWDRNRLDFKVGRIIGKYHRETSLEEVADRLGVEIVSSSNY